MHLFVPAIWMAAGISLFAGIHFTIAGAGQRREPGFLAFGLLCLLISAYVALTAQIYLTHSVAAASRIARYRVALLCFTYPVAVWFIGEFTGLRKLWPWLTSAGLLFGNLLLVNVVSPHSLLYSAITQRAPLVLPWGETLSDFVGSPAPLAAFYYVACYAVFLWALWRCAVTWQAKVWKKALPLAAFLVVQLATFLHDEIVVQLGLRSVLLGDFAYLILVLVMSFALRRELQERAAALKQSVSALRTETARRQRVESQLQHMAYHDYLTNLPNRRLLRKILRGALAHHRASGQYGAIVFLDLDHFKTINDSLGHQVGDGLLKLIAERLRGALPESRCVSRLGGDEFAVVMGHLGRDREQAAARALHAAEALSASLVRPFHIGHHELIVGASTGVTVFPDSAADESSIIRQADMALYSAKAAGRNTAAVFASQMQADASRRLVVEKGLRAALDRRELKLYYQPQVDMDGTVTGAEALLRWFHPQHGFIEPRHFIPVAEETGLIHAIGDYVLNSVCNSIHAWDEERIPIPRRLSLNVSPWQLATHGFANRVRRSIQLAGIEPQRLTLEITENAVLQDMDEVARTIRELSGIGVRFSIDDFGSGYSALASLKKLPLHELKIDRIFISEMSLVPKDNFIETIIAMAYHMNLQVIAEGVETEAQRQALAAMGCLGFQGYLVSPPLPARDFERWLLAMRAPLPPLTSALHPQALIETGM